VHSDTRGRLHRAQGLLRGHQRLRNRLTRMGRTKLAPRSVM
jgi:hypothetical protein